MSGLSGSLEPHGTLSGSLSNARPTLSGTLSFGHVSSGDKTFVYTQSSAADIWVIDHNLAKFPSVTIVDSNGDVVIGDVQYVSINEIRITFDIAFSGTAYLN